MLSETRSVLGAAREMVVDGKAAEAGPASGAATLAASTAPAAFLALQRSVGNRGAVATARQIGAIPRVHIARCAGDCTCGGRCTEDELLPEPFGTCGEGKPGGPGPDGAGAACGVRRHS